MIDPFNMKKAILLLLLCVTAPTQAQEKNWGFVDLTKKRAEPRVKDQGNGIIRLIDYRKDRIFNLPMKNLSKMNTIHLAETSTKKINHVRIYKDRINVFHWNMKDPCGLQTYFLKGKDGSLISEKLVKSDNFKLKKRRLFTSPNNKYTLTIIMGVKKNKEGKNSQNYVTTLLNDKLEVLFKREKLRYNEKTFSGYLNIKVDNDGSIYVLRKNKYISFNALKDFERWEEEIKFEPIDEQMALGGYTADLKIAFDKKNDLILTGFFVPNKFVNGKKFFSDIASHIVIMKIDNFSKEIIKTHLVHLGDHAVRIQGKHRNRLIFKRDGGYVLLKEEREMYGYYINTGEPFYLDNRAYSKVSIYNISKEGKLLWAKTILKHQVYLKKTNILWAYTGFFADIFKDKLVVLYNDRVENLDAKTEKDLKKLKHVKKMVCFKETFDMKTGANTKEIFFSKRDRKNEKVQLTPYYMRKVEGKNQIILLASKKHSAMVRIMHQYFMNSARGNKNHKVALYTVN